MSAKPLQTLYSQILLFRCTIPMATHQKTWHLPSSLPSPHNSTIYHIQNPTNKLTTSTVLINMQHVKSVYD